MEFLLIGGLVLAWILITVSMEYESGFGATVVLLSTAGVLQFWTELKPFTMIYEHPMTALWLFLAYVVAGVLVGGLKWVSFVHKWVDRRKEYAADNRVDVKTVSGFDLGARFKVPLTIKEHKARLMSWMTYWPMTALWTLIDDPIRRVFSWFYNGVAKGFQNYSDRAFGVK